MLTRLTRSIDFMLSETRYMIERAVAGEPKALVIVLGGLALMMAIFYRLLRIKEPP